MLVCTDYNQRVAECAVAVRELLTAAGRTDELPLLGKVSANEYAIYGGRLTGGPSPPCFAHLLGKSSESAAGPTPGAAVTSRHSAHW